MLMPTSVSMAHPSLRDFELSPTLDLECTFTVLPNKSWQRCKSWFINESPHVGPSARSPNSSPSQARFNPNEPNLWSSWSRFLWKHHPRALRLELHFYYDMKVFGIQVLLWYFWKMRHPHLRAHGRRGPWRFELRKVRRVRLMLPGQFFKIGPSGLFTSLNCSYSMPWFVGNHFSLLLHITGVGVKYFSLALAIFAIYTNFTLMN
jgi:hypothetical protein